MRCSTNIYLTALAIADIINLFCAFILSLQQYPGYKFGHVLYWSAFGLSNWFHDASRMYYSSSSQIHIKFHLFFFLFVSVYISIYLTVSFTLERYISVCHPLRGQVLCTESRAKKVITGKQSVWSYFNLTHDRFVCISISMDCQAIHHEFQTISECICNFRILNRKIWFSKTR